jgi:Sec-independent protein translocase protein TatA
LFNINFLELVIILIILITLFSPKELLVLCFKFYKIYLNIKQIIFNMIQTFELEQIKQELEIFDLKNDIINNDELEPVIYYQPELDFDYQPELFD